MAIVQNVRHLFVNAYSGIKREVWLLSLIMLINRSGALVFPFLSIYLTRHLGFSEIQAGWVLSAYGVGSMVGTLTGGWLTDKYGSFRTQFGALVLSGIGWIILAHITEYHHLLMLAFIQSSIGDIFRPANNSSITLFTDAGNRTRSFSLNRMAMNLGYSIGPAIGGIFATISYTLLFWGDGLSCIFSSIAFFIIFRRYFTKKGPVEEDRPEIPVRGETTGPLKDTIFLVFVISVILFATVFFQMLFTLPIYYAQHYKIGEAHIGTLLAVNGLFVFVSEMAFVHYVGNRIENHKLIIAGVLATGLSFIMLNWVHHSAWLIVAMIVLSLAEILSMPFMQTYVANRATQSNIGRYLALYSFAFSVAFIFAFPLGMWTIKNFGFHMLWNGCMAVAAINTVVIYFVFKADKHRKASLKSERG